MNTSDALVSLQAMAPDLTEKEITHIYTQECNKDFNQSVDYLLARLRTEEKSNTNRNTNNSYNQNKWSAENCNIEPSTMEAIKRIARVLFTYDKSHSSSINTNQLLDDFVLIEEKDSKDRNLHLFEFVDRYLRREYFHGKNECKMDTCKCMNINTRNRLDEGQRKLDANDLLLSSIHCSLLHSFDSGYRLTKAEMNIITNAVNIAEEDEMQNESAIDLLVDRGTHLMRDTLNARREKYQSMREDQNIGNNKNVEQKIGSKFVTVIEEESEQKNDNNNSSSTVRRMFGYSFGIKFYYWNKAHKKNEHKIDAYYNGGQYTFGDWFIPQKFASLKEELFDNPYLPISLDCWAEEREKAGYWLKTIVVKNMMSDEYMKIDYDIEDKTPISLAHLQSLAFYTNLTALCTAFSRVFRRIPSSESDESLKERNSNFREWARLLIETIHVWGVYMYESKISVFYHGISLEMTFTSTFAVFCSPTSTTDLLPVAVTFAKKGMILELQNSRSQAGLTFFNCIMSDFNNESEKLFMNGGCRTIGSKLQFTALPFASIRSLEFNLNYKDFIIAISSFQQLVKGRNAMKNSLPIVRKNVRRLKRLIVNQLSDAKIDSKKNHGMFYIQSMFNEYVLSLDKIQIFIMALNYKMWEKYKAPLFVLYRELFCELYSDMILEANAEKWSIQSNKHWYHSEGFVNPIKNLKIGMLLDLCPNVKNFEILELPITRFVMDQLLSIIDVKQSGIGKYDNIERFFVGILFHSYNMESSYPESQRDFESFAACIAEYNDRFESRNWKMTCITNVEVGEQNFQISGIDIIWKDSDITFENARSTFFV